MSIFRGILILHEWIFTKFGTYGALITEEDLGCFLNELRTY